MINRENINSGYKSQLSEYYEFKISVIFLDKYLLKYVQNI